MKRFKRRVLSVFSLSVVVAFLATPKCAVGTPVYSQVLPGEPVGAFSSLNAPGLRKIADNFALNGPEPSTIRSLRFIGGATGVPAPSPPDDFRIVFLDDNGGTPGTPLPGGDFAVGSAFGRKPTGGQLLNGVTEPYEYIINLASGIILSPGTTYWISISNDLLPDNGWAWARASGVLDPQTAGTRNDLIAGPWDTVTTGGMFFELDNQFVPEPTSMALFVIALTQALLLRRHIYATKHYSAQHSSLNR